jgi:hypothetical protein
MLRKGFMLMEFLIYLALFTVIMLALMGMVAQLWIPAMSYTKKQSCRIDLVTAHDCFMRDVKNAKAEKTSWKIISSNTLIFTAGDHDIGWTVKEGDLIRIEGTFNVKKATWQKATKSLIVKDIDKTIFAINGDPEVQYVSFLFAKAGDEIKSEVVLINGTLPWKVKKK